MVATGRMNRVAFYCRMNHRDKDYTRFLPEIEEMLDEKFGKNKWEMKLFFEVASGADAKRKEFSRLKAEIQAGNFESVVTMKASTLARDWEQFLEFMETCEASEVSVFCIHQPENAEEIYQRIQRFKQLYFEGCGVL